MTDTELPQSDMLAGVPHPRDCKTLFGQNLAEEDFLKAVNSKRLHHAWLITGPKGIGKATLAWRAARFILINSKTWVESVSSSQRSYTSLDVNAGDPVNNRINASSEAGLFALRRNYDRGKKRFQNNITVDEVRKLKNFFSLSSTDGSWRVVIIDSVDDMNVNSLNALLKSLEEPPQNCIFFLISNNPSKLLPTVRSRCRTLNCLKLNPEAMENALKNSDTNMEGLDGIITLADGSVGGAINLKRQNALEIYSSLLETVKTFPNLDGHLASTLSEKVSTRGENQNFDTFIKLFEILTSRLALAGLGMLNQEIVKYEKSILTHLSNTVYHAQEWARVLEEQGRRLNYGKQVNIDASTLILDTIINMNKTSAKLREY
ncbi:MAG: DNA polymerase III subunit delta' [Proteobacteria bacterium]|nr:DNA polymerase III subunit delta' [Pseudomonadota bacterium]MDA1238927.1 DNA polymerase III subunit delta' [Pseudomonadota bacterium]